MKDLERPIKLILRGPSGGGKTLLASQMVADKTSKVALINFDDNLSSLRRLTEAARSQVMVINPLVLKNGKTCPVTQFFDNLVEILSTVLADKTVATVVFDSVSTFANQLTWQLYGSRDPKKKPAGFDHWFALKNHYQKLMDEIVHAPDLDKNLIFICHESVEKNDLDQTLRYELNIQGSMQQEFSLHFTDVWTCYPKTSSTKPPEFRVCTGPQPLRANKCSLPIDFDFSVDMPTNGTTPEKVKELKAFFKNLSK